MISKFVFFFIAALFARLSLLVAGKEDPDKLIVVAYKYETDCPDVNPDYRASFLTYYAECVYESMSSAAGGRLRRGLLASTTNKYQETSVAPSKTAVTTEENRPDSRELTSCSTCRAAVCFQQCFPSMCAHYNNICSVLYPNVCRQGCSRRDLEETSMNSFVGESTESDSAELLMELEDDLTSNRNFEQKNMNVKDEMSLWFCACEKLVQQGLETSKEVTMGEVNKLCKCPNTEVHVLTKYGLD